MHKALAWLCLMSMVAAACSGDDAGGAVTTPAPTAATSTTSPIAVTGDDTALAQALLLRFEDFGQEWIARQRSEEDPYDYSQIPGCEVMEALLADETHSAEALSPTFAAGTAQIEQDVRIYPTPADAFAVLTAWTDDDVVPCLDEGLNRATAESVELGGFGDVETFEASVQGDIDVAEGFSFVLHNGNVALSGETEQGELYLWSYVMHRDRAIVRLNLSRSGEDFVGQVALIALIAQRFDAAGLE